MIGIEASDVAAAATAVVAANGLEGKVEVLHSAIEDVQQLPGGVQKVDAIVSEWMGYALFYEYMLESVILARERFLKEGGRMYPATARLFLAPFSDEDSKDATAAFWKCQYGLNLSPVAYELQPTSVS